MNNQAAQTMPALPRPYWKAGDVKDDYGNPYNETDLFTDDDMRAMYQQGYAAALAQTAGVADGWKLVPVEPTEVMCEAAMSSLGWTRSEAAAKTAPITPASPMMEGSMKVWSAMLAAAPAASGVDTSTNEAWAARAQEKIATMDAAASVSERARELLAAEYRTHGWHEDAGRLCMGGDPTSFVEDDALRVITRLIEQGDEDTHVITELGRLLAGIAVILKGPEPAGTAWSYHDLPELVASALSEPRQVAAEMKAWAHTKMAEQQSSRRDRMMVAEWAKRLLPESSFPVKDFDVEGMSITKEAAREAAKQVALEQALTQPSDAQRERDLLAEAIANAGIKCGLLRNDIEGLTGPQLLMVCDDMAQALTQQRGSSVFDRAWVVRDAELRAAAYNLLKLVEGVGCDRWQNANGFRLKDTKQWVEFYIATKNVQSFGETTTPQPSADAVRELVKRWREYAAGTKKYAMGDYESGCAAEQNRCADELESLISAASGEGVG